MSGCGDVVHHINNIQTENKKYIYAKKLVHIFLLCFGICVFIAFAGHVLKTTNHVLERAEKQSEIICVVIFFFTGAVQER